jgi:hypothetical protein
MINGDPSTALRSLQYTYNSVVAAAPTGVAAVVGAAFGSKNALTELHLQNPTGATVDFTFYLVPVGGVVGVGNMIHMQSLTTKSSAHPVVNFTIPPGASLFVLASAAGCAAGYNVKIEK